MRISLSISFLLLVLCGLHAQETTKVYPFSYQGQWGIIDSEREIILEPSLDKVELFWDSDQATGNTYASKNGHQGVINGYGKWIVKPKMDSIVHNRFYNFPHLLWVIRDGKFGLMSLAGKKGKWLAKPRFTSVEEEEGRKIALIPVAIDNRWGVINSNGEMVAECDYDEVMLFETWSDYPYIKLSKNGYITYLDAFGTPKDSLEMDRIEMMDEDWDDVAIDASGSGPGQEPRSRTLAGQAGGTLVTFETYLDGAYQIAQQVLIPSDYHISKVQLDEYYSKGIRFIQVEKDGKHGFFGLDGFPSTSAIYDRIEWTAFPYSSQVALLHLNNQIGLANRYGKMFLPACFDKISGDGDLLFVEHSSGYSGYANYEGQVFLPPSVELKE